MYIVHLSEIFKFGKIIVMKNKSTAYLLWLLGLVCICGVHQFYLGKTGKGFLYLLTFGIFGIGQLIDLFTLGGQVDNVNTKNELMHLRTATGALLANSNQRK